MATAVVHTNGTKQLEYVLGFIQTEQFSVKIEKKKNIGINDGPVFVKENTKLSGLITVAKALARHSNNLSLIGENPLESAEIDQWLDYGKLQLNCDRRSRLKELDVYLSDKVFFVNNKITLVDILFFGYLYKDLTTLSHAENESLVNLVRWCDQMQNIPQVIGKKSKKLLLQRTLLY